MGNTIAFDNHNDAVNFFLKDDGDYCWNTECVKYFEKIISKAKDIGYDSIQFLYHSDMRWKHIYELVETLLPKSYQYNYSNICRFFRHTH